MRIEEKIKPNLFAKEEKAIQLHKTLSEWDEDSVTWNTRWKTPFDLLLDAECCFSIVTHKVCLQTKLEFAQYLSKSFHGFVQVDTPPPYTPHCHPQARDIRCSCNLRQPPRRVPDVCKHQHHRGFLGSSRLNKKYLLGTNRDFNLSLSDVLTGFALTASENTNGQIKFK